MTTADNEQRTTDHGPRTAAYIGLGSNLGDRAAYLLLAIRGMLDAGLRPIRLSHIYESAPIGVTDQPHFLNMVAKLDGNSLPPPGQLLARLLRIEYALGRTRDVPQGPRTIDLDLLLYKDHTSDTEYLKLPHPRLHLRRFVLAPLNELCPNFVHPTLNTTIRDLLEKTDDNSAVRLWRG